MSIDIIYAAGTLFLMIGCAFMSYNIGKREGVMRLLSFLDENANDKGIIKIRISEEEFEILRDNC